MSVGPLDEPIKMHLEYALLEYALDLTTYAVRAAVHWHKSFLCSSFNS